LVFNTISRALADYHFTYLTIIWADLLFFAPGSIYTFTCVGIPSDPYDALASPHNKLIKERSLAMTVAVATVAAAAVFMAVAAMTTTVTTAAAVAAIVVVATAAATVAAAAAAAMATAMKAATTGRWWWGRL
jgi:hypothetical protein